MRRFGLFIATFLFVGLGSAMAATKCEAANARLLDAQITAKASYKAAVAKRDAALKKYEDNLDLAQTAGRIPTEPIEKTDFSELEKKVDEVCEKEVAQLVNQWVIVTNQLVAALCRNDADNRACANLREVVDSIKAINSKDKAGN